jgi:hypothetical protein
MFCHMTHLTVTLSRLHSALISSPSQPRCQWQTTLQALSLISLFKFCHLAISIFRYGDTSSSNAPLPSAPSPQTYNKVLSFFNLPVLVHNSVISSHSIYNCHCRGWTRRPIDDFRQLCIFNYNTHEQVAAFEAYPIPSPDYIRCLTASVYPTVSKKRRYDSDNQGLGLEERVGEHPSKHYTLAVENLFCI